MLEGVNKPIDVQLEVLENILMQNERLVTVLKILEQYAKEKINFKNYYLGAGGINQTVFNYYHGYDLNYGIKDYDIVYFDSDVSYDAEDIVISELNKRFSLIPLDDVELEIIGAKYPLSKTTLSLSKQSFLKS